MKNTHRLVAAAIVAVGLIPLAAPAQAGEMDDAVYAHAGADRLEYRAHDGTDTLYWEADGWIGTDDNRLAVKTRGEKAVGGSLESAELQLLYRRPVSDFFDLNAGLRHDFRPNPDRTYAVIGLQGLAKQFVETDANLFVSQKGDVSARLETTVDWLLTQRLVLQPTMELNAAFSEDAAVKSGAGLNSLELGLRLRYEVTRKFAPYIGLHWERKLGATGNFVRQEGGDAENLFFVGGVKLWF